MTRSRASDANDWRVSLLSWAWQNLCSIGMELAVRGEDIWELRGRVGGVKLSPRVGGRTRILCGRRRLVIWRKWEVFWCGGAVEVCAREQLSAGETCGLGNGGSTLNDVTAYQACTRPIARVALPGGCCKNHSDPRPRDRTREIAPRRTFDAPMPRKNGDYNAE
jgi:hypothetical protein